MHLRRKLAISLGATLLAAPVLTSCGFDYATDRVYTPAAGDNNRDQDLDVLGAVIVAEHAGEGTFVAGLANNDLEDAITVTGLTARDGVDVTATDFSPVEVAPRGFVNLADDGNGVFVSGAIAAGDFVPLSVALDNGQTVELEVPVVTRCDMWADVEMPSSAGGSTGQPSDEASPYSCEIAEGSHSEEGGH